MTTTKFHLESSPIHLSADSRATRVPDFAGDYARYEQRHCRNDDGGRLIGFSHTLEDWPVWECHPAGDEVVIVLSGKAELVQLIDGEERRTVLTTGEAIINPAGVRHTANVIQPFSAVYITPCPGTEHHPR
jgi:mannose-6-phosphate isomerase-like protein (cupin superfamily)